MNLYEKTLSEEIVYTGDYLTFTKVKVQLPDGNEANRDIIKHPGACGIIPFVDENHIILIRQFRKSIDKVIYEIPAGKLSSDESPENCAYREIEEETGYQASSLFHLGTVAIVPGYCDELLYIYKATNLSLSKKHEDFDEFTEVEIFTLEEVKNMIKSGEIIDAKTITALAYTMIMDNY